MADEMKKLRVGCYGAKGSYTYEAMERQFGEREREEHYYPLFEDVLKAVSEGAIDYGVVPIENSSTGGITEVYDLIMKYDCAVVGEQLIKIGTTFWACRARRSRISTPSTRTRRALPSAVPSSMSTGTGR